MSGALALAAITISIEAIDRPSVEVWRSVASDPLIATAELLAKLGSPIPYFVISAVAFAFFKFERRQTINGNRALFVLLAATIAPFTTDLLELVFGRARPRLLLEHGDYTFHFFTNNLNFSSFPSEEATVAAAMAATFSMLVRSYRPTLVFMAGIVAISPIFSGAHYPSDVLAGSFVGLAVVSLLASTFRLCKLELFKANWPGRSSSP